MGLQKSRSARRIKNLEREGKKRDKDSDGKAVKFIFLGIGMTEIMPVPLLSAHFFDHRPFCKLIMPFGHKGCIKQEDFGAIETAKDWLLQRG